MIKVDARGLACPKPVINTKKELDKLNEGVVITTVDNTIAKENLFKLANSLKCEVSVVREEDGEIDVQIVKGEASAEVEVKNNEELSDQVVLITSDRMGSGNDELGKVLIKGFIYTLTETKPYPKAVVLVNGGVTLSTENEATIENLQILEEKGVTVLSCGTCLDYYGLKDSLKAGSVSNMYDIVETLKSASNTITIG